jgi:hypothetical protein
MHQADRSPLPKGDGMTTLRGFVIGFVVAIAIGGAASAAPRLVTAVRGTPTSGLVGHASATPSPEPTEGDEPDRQGIGQTGSALTGLDNAVARVSANLAKHPNAGLQTALSHLEANQAKHAGAKGHAGRGKD